MVRKIWQIFCEFGCICMFWEMSRNSAKKSSKSTVKMANLLTEMMENAKFWKVNIHSESEKCRRTFSLKCWDRSGAKVCTSCRSRQELSHERLVFTCKNRLRYSRERASQSLKVIQFIYPLDSSGQAARRAAAASEKSRQKPAFTHWRSRHVAR